MEKPSARMSNLSTVWFLTPNFGFLHIPNHYDIKQTRDGAQPRPRSDTITSILAACYNNGDAAMYNINAGRKC